MVTSISVTPRHHLWYFRFIMAVVLTPSMASQAMNFNFGQARLADGVTYMRFDDTNPTAEKQEYIDSILGSVDWLGNKPFKITYSSDYFQDLYELAVKLIKVLSLALTFPLKSKSYLAPLTLL